MNFSPLTKFVKTIPHRDWNSAVNRFARNRPLEVKVIASRSQPHAWKTSARWNDEQEQWTLETRAGYVNAEETVVSIAADQAPEKTLSRLGESDPKTRVDAWLSERPRYPVGNDLWRTLGAGAIALQSGVERVPDYFLELGVEPAKESVQVSGTTITTQISGMVQSSARRRLLRAVEIVLSKPRPAVRVDWSTEADSLSAFVNIVPASGPAYLTVRRTYESEAAADNTLAQLAGGLVDDGLDELHVATVYLVSRPGAPLGSKPDATWSPYIKHRLFYNLSHEVDRDLLAIPEDPLVFSTFGLGGGAGEGVVQGLLSGLNEAEAQAQALLNRSQIRGKFWSV